MKLQFIWTAWASGKAENHWHAESALSPWCPLKWCYHLPVWNCTYPQCHFHISHPLPYLCRCSKWVNGNILHEKWKHTLNFISQCGLGFGVIGYSVFKYSFIHSSNFQGSGDTFMGFTEFFDKISWLQCTFNFSLSNTEPNCTSNQVVTFSRTFSRYSALLWVHLSVIMFPPNTYFGIQPISCLFWFDF